MVSAPRLSAVGRTCVSFGQLIGGLEYDLHRDMPFIFGKYLFTEVLFKVLTYYEYYFPESRIDGVIDRIVHDCLAVRA
jgi:hypothetical protein